MGTLSSPAADTDAAVVLGMASTALPFARSPREQAERWLRLLRAHGEAGVVLQALGVSEAPLEEGGAEPHPDDARAPEEAVKAVTEAAKGAAARRGAAAVGTGDVLWAVIEVYGDDFDAVLRTHGTDRQEVLERLADELPGAQRP